MIDTSDLNVVINVSCITKCYVPLAKVINDEYDIEESLMTIVNLCMQTSIL